MRWVALAFVALIALQVVVADNEDMDKPHKKKHHNKHKKKHHAKKAPKPTGPARRCDKGMIEVANSLCCPKDHPTLIDSTCYADCGDGFDDMTVGAWVGCREMCEGGYASSINECTNGILTRPRKDHARDGVAAKAQASVASLPTPVYSTCETGFVVVKRSGHGSHKHGGCCPAEYPTLIRGRCYGGCDANKDEITLGDFVGCRAHCPEGWDQHTNDCTKDHENPTDRGDFPRDGYRPHDRIVLPKPASTVDPNHGCKSGFVGASKRYCCPATQPILIDLLCYEKCRTGYEESRYGCRKACPEGWSKSTLQCHKGAKTFHRKGYERHPKPSQLRGL